MVTAAVPHSYARNADYMHCKNRTQVPHYVSCTVHITLCCMAKPWSYYGHEYSPDDQ